MSRPTPGTGLAVPLRISAVMALLATLSLPGIAHSQFPPPFVLKWSDDFVYPGGVAVDKAGNVYVADQQNQRIEKFDNNGNFITKWGSAGTGPGLFANPGDVSVGPDGLVYVLDTDSQSPDSVVQVFTTSGGFVRGWGSHGVADQQFQFPGSIGVGPDGNVYISSGYQGTDELVRKFSSDGTYLGRLGSYGSGPGQFQGPAGIGFDAAGNVYVADSYGARIEKFASSGAYLAQWGSYGTADGQFRCPGDVAFSPQGVVCVTDCYGRIQAFTPDGVFIAGWGSYGTGDGQFRGLDGIAIDTNGNVFVSDNVAFSVTKFGGSAVPVRHSTWGSVKVLYR